MSHTPGPWQALPPAQWEGKDGQWIVPGVAHCGKGEWSGGNARLIAAAPDMLAALKRITPAYAQHNGETPLVIEARAAMAKAEGAAPDREDS